MDKINVIAEDQIKDVSPHMGGSGNKLSEVELKDQFTDSSGMGRSTRQGVPVDVREVEVPQEDSFNVKWQEVIKVVAEINVVGGARLRGNIDETNVKGEFEQ